MEQLQIWQILIVFILGGIFVFLLVVLLPLINQLKKTAHQLEITAASLNEVLNREFKALLNRGEKVIEEFEEIPPLVKDKLTRIPSKATRFAFAGIGSHVAKSLILWTLKGAWRKIRGRKRKKNS